MTRLCLEHIYGGLDSNGVDDIDPYIDVIPEENNDWIDGGTLMKFN